MKKLIKPPKALKKIVLLILSALILTLLTISPAVASVSTNKNYSFLNEIEHNVDFAYMLAGMGAALLIVFIYLLITRGDSDFITDLRKTLYSFKTRKIKPGEEAVKEKGVPEIKIAEKVVHEGEVQEEIVREVAIPKKVVPEPEVYKEVTAKQLKLDIMVPILFIAIAELLIFFGQLDIAVWVHILVLFALSLSNILIRDPKVHKIHLPLMLLPLLRLVSLSMPVFSNMTLYTFVLYYTPLAIPIAAIMIHQRDSLAEMGITKKHLLPYIILAVPLSFLLGLGEYLTIRPGYLIRILSFQEPASARGYYGLLCRAGRRSYLQVTAPDQARKGIKYSRSFIDNEFPVRSHALWVRYLLRNALHRLRRACHWDNLPQNQELAVYCSFAWFCQRFPLRDPAPAYVWLALIF